MAPAVPSTSAQRARYERMLHAAAATLSLGGEDALQMKELARRADVSLATLYRYFPSKDHILLAICRSRFENALRQVAAEPLHGATVQDRVTNHLLREFRAQQREQKLTDALTRVLADTRPDYGPIIRPVQRLHLTILRQVAVRGRPLSDEECRRLRIVNDVFGFSTRRWLAGVSSAAEARFEIRMACYLLSGPEVFPR
jgi:TetR/AcrR family transcriptional regulator, cholesterol catabolism regulator